LPHGIPLCRRLGNLRFRKFNPCPSLFSARNEAWTFKHRCYLRFGALLSSLRFGNCSSKSSVCSRNTRCNCIYDELLWRNTCDPWNVFSYSVKKASFRLPGNRYRRRFSPQYRTIFYILSALLQCCFRILPRTLPRLTYHRYLNSACMLYCNATH